MSLIAIAAATGLAMLIAWAIGGDREDNDARGTYDAGVADEMPQDVANRIAAAIQAEVTQR